MTRDSPVRVLTVGDPFVPHLFTAALAGLRGRDGVASW